LIHFNTLGGGRTNNSKKGAIGRKGVQKKRKGGRRRKGKAERDVGALVKYTGGRKQVDRAESRGRRPATQDQTKQHTGQKPSKRPRREAPTQRAKVNTHPKAIHLSPPTLESSAPSFPLPLVTFYLRKVSLPLFSKGCSYFGSSPNSWSRINTSNSRIGTPRWPSGGPGPIRDFDEDLSCTVVASPQDNTPGSKSRQILFPRLNFEF